MAQLEIDVSVGEGVYIYKQHQVRVPPYDCISNGIGRRGMKGFNPTPVLAQLSGKAANFFWLLYGLRDKDTNIVFYEAKDATERNKISSWYKELNKVLFIKRIKPKTYLINPHAFYPTFNEYEKVREHWDSLT